MLISIHLGAHATDADLLLKSLRKCDKVFKREGVVLPPANIYRGLIADTLRKLKGAEASRQTQDMLIETLMGDEKGDRIVLSHDDFICHIVDVFDGPAFYRKAPIKARWLRNLFSQHQVEFHMGLRNPATLIPAMAASPRHKRSYADLTRGMAPQDARWLPVITDMRAAVPDAPLTLWAYEDSPLVWSEVIREIAGLAPMAPVRGGFDLVGRIMAPEGMIRLRKYLSETPIQTEIQARRVLMAFLEKYALDDEIEDEIDLPGWTAELIEVISQTYEDDLYQIARLPGVAMITP